MTHSNLWIMKNAICRSVDTSLQQPTKLRTAFLALERGGPEPGGDALELYEPNGFEVEFVMASGQTAAVLTLTAHDARPVAADDLVSVRPCSRSTDDGTL